MKTFDDLEFTNRAYNGEHATMQFANKYGVYVISGLGSYSDSERPYEVTVLYEDELCYQTYITNDVLGYQTKEDVTFIMKQIQELES